MGVVGWSLRDRKGYMKKNVFLSLVVTGLSAVPAFAASTIGIATGVGAFSVNSAPVTGNVDVIDGAQLRTTIAPSDVHLDNGVELRLATRSAGTVFDDHLVLREGAIRVANFDSYKVHVSDLQVQADTPGTAAIVRMSGKTIEIASIGGSVTVTDGGAMLTRVTAGSKMAFQNQTPGQTGAAPGQTGAAPAPNEKGPISDKKVILWSAGVCAVGAMVVGGIAAAQGKSPF